MSRQLRNLTGVVLLDKPLGYSSNQALQKVKRILQARKAGHTGSLDPLATGLLPLCLGEATKFSQFLLDADKKYQVTAKLGVQTATGDAEGEIIAQAAVPSLNEADLKKFLHENFLGELSQIPSMYSALKHKGEPLYVLARQGIEVERQPRKIIIYALEEIKLSQPDEINFVVHCSKGTYVRTLVEDIGKALGSVAYVSQLRRIGCGPYRAEQMLSLEYLSEQVEQDNLAAVILPIDTMLNHYPVIKLSKNSANYLCQGTAIFVPNSPTQGLVRLVLDEVQPLFLGIGEIIQDGKIAPLRLISN